MGEFTGDKLCGTIILVINQIKMQSFTGTIMTELENRRLCMHIVQSSRDLNKSYTQYSTLQLTVPIAHNKARDWK